MSDGRIPTIEQGAPLTGEVLLATPISEWVSNVFYWVFILVLVLNMMQRRHQAHAQKKRFATLYFGLAFFAFWLGATLILEFGGADWMLAPLLVLIVGVIWYFRRYTLPFRLTSPKDGRRLTMQEILFDDNHGDGHETDSDA